MPNQRADTKVMCSRCKCHPPAADRKSCSRCLVQVRGYIGKNWKTRKDEYIALGLCVSCGKAKAEENCFYHCRECRDKKCANTKARTQRLRMEALMAYGGPICVCCGEATLAFLTLDHIHGGGNRERKERSKKSSAYWYYWLKKNGYTTALQVLCFNCNIGRSINGGICPHKENRGEDDVQEREVGSARNHPCD